MKKMLVLLMTVCMLVTCISSCTAGGSGGAESDDVSETVHSTDEVTQTESPTDTAANGGTRICTVHEMTYHYVPGTLMDLVEDQDAVKAWFEEKEKPVLDGSDCLYPTGNIYEFIHDFGITREQVEEEYGPGKEGYYSTIADVDLLMSDDAEAVDHFYRNLDELNPIHEKRWALWEIKTKAEYLYDELLDDKLGDRDLLAMSMGEIADYLELSQDELEAVIDDLCENRDKRYILDYSAIYDEDGNIIDDAFPMTPAEAMEADEAIITVKS